MLDKHLAQLDVVVNLAIEDDHVSTRRIMHRLLAARDIDNRKPIVRGTEVVEMDDPSFIRSPVRLSTRNCIKLRLGVIRDASSW